MGGRHGSRELDDLSTVEEAAQFLRIGRGMAYRAARRYLDTGGEQGLPVILLGRNLRVPKLLLVAVDRRAPPRRPATGLER